MLDFAIFAVTFLLALVAAVLYLYPVTAVSASGALAAARASVLPVCTSLCAQRAAGGRARGRWVPAPAPAWRGGCSGARDAPRVRMRAGSPGG